MISAGFGALPIRPDVFTRLFASIRLCLCPEQVTISPISICVGGLFVLVVVDSCFVYLLITEALVVVHLELAAHRHHMISEAFIFLRHLYF